MIKSIEGDCSKVEHKERKERDDSQLLSDGKRKAAKANNTKSIVERVTAVELSG